MVLRLDDMPRDQDEVHVEPREDGSHRQEVRAQRELLAVHGEDDNGSREVGLRQGEHGLPAGRDELVLLRVGRQRQDAALHHAQSCTSRRHRH